MDLYEAIRRRCSIRSYRDRAVEEDTLRRILDAGRLAPSGNNRQEYRFVVVRDAAQRNALAQAAGQAFMAQAPVIIAVVSFAPDRMMYCQVPAGPVDCAIAIDHMALAATAEGLGSCWIGHFDQQACCRLLNVPAGAKIIEMLTMGYGASAGSAKTRKDLSEIVSYERM